ncbi:MAG: Uma2 family endonuclease [Sulfuricella sp.]|nr:Uma2 family endonuclease [Sulfuricella sp.]
MNQAKLQKLSEAEYLAMEAQSPVRHELVGGQVYAMAGASARHNRIAGALYAKLLTAAGADCQVFISDVKLRADDFPTYYYPDVMLVCDPSDDDALVKTRPCLLAEVLSPTTEATDRREKLAAYRRLSSLREYLLLSQDEPRIEIYRRRGLAEWLVETLGAEDVLHIDCLSAEVSVSELYRGILE